jgi:polyisoprenyl-phosphate glycosyltransferase
MAQRISVVVPAYNEELVINETHKRLNDALSSIAVDYEIIYVNDGSRDKTIERLPCKDTELFP